MEDGVEDEGGVKFCKPYNDQRGCRRGEKCKQSHRCDILVQGKACGRDHKRKAHDPAAHGKPEPR